jgi:hypothetical protein
LTVSVAERYRAADRKGKKAILDEFAKVTGYHRKHAIRVLSNNKQLAQRKPAGQRVYQEAVEESLIVLWEAADRICGTRLKAAMPTLVEAMERHGHLMLEETIRGLLLSMSAATIDRRLKKVREEAFGTRRQKRPLNRIRRLVTARTFADWEDLRQDLWKWILLHTVAQGWWGVLCILWYSRMWRRLDRVHCTTGSRASADCRGGSNG